MKNPKAGVRSLKEAVGERWAAAGSGPGWDEGGAEPSRSHPLAGCPDIALLCVRLLFTAIFLSLLQTKDSLKDPFFKSPTRENWQVWWPSGFDVGVLDDSLGSHFFAGFQRVGSAALALPALAGGVLGWCFERFQGHSFRCSVGGTCHDTGLTSTELACSKKSEARVYTT